MMSSTTFLAQRVFRRAFPEDPIPRRPDAPYSAEETRRQKTSQIFPELKTRNACLHDSCEDPRLLMKPSLLNMSQIHQAMPVGLHNFPMKQPDNCDGDATRTDERQLFGDLGGQTGIAYVTSGGEIDAYRNIQETGAYAVQCLPTRTTTPSLPTAGGGYVGITRDGAELDQLARSMIEAGAFSVVVQLSLRASRYWSHRPRWQLRVLHRTNEADPVV
ncbi:hypothetical protein FPRO03_13141 [Fusarium proliferatum]|nr:hypothetical protein FPRO03_13141 [Fusarium proliferatum]